MGAFFRIAGAVWIGWGLIDLWKIRIGDQLGELPLMSHMIFYGIPGLLAIGIGVSLQKKTDDV